jgi:hypothetical protein
MNRAQLYLWSVLHSREQVDEGVIAELANQAESHLSIADKKQRRSDLQAAVGAWSERTDLPDSDTYLSNLRDEARSERLLPA